MAKLILMAIAFVFSSALLAEAGNNNDCATCGSNTPQEVSAGSSMGDGQLSKLAAAVIDSEGGVTRVPASKPKIERYQVILLCDSWSHDNWDEFEQRLDKYGLKLKDIYYDLKCDYQTDMKFPLLYRVNMSPLEYKVTYKKLMRRMQKEGGNDILTCAINHLRYSNETMVSEAEYAITLAERRNATESDPEKIRIRTKMIGIFEKQLAYWKKHTDKFPVANPDQNCPKW